MLKVVQQEQKILLLQVGFQLVQQGSFAGFFESQCLGGRGDDQARVAKGGQWDEADAILEYFAQLCRYLEAQATLPYTSRASDCQQAHIRPVEKLLYASYLSLAPNQRRGLLRQVAFEGEPRPYLPAMEVTGRLSVHTHFWASKTDGKEP
ncbi:MAG TPA: hypothetical protein VFR55_03825 [Dehalococcoidia bacterium]|nr:hypothetical protein [Dehalococcoidia bacterium]